MPFSCFLFRRTGILLKFAQNRLEIHLCDKVATLPRRSLHKGLHGETRAFRMGVVSLPSERFTRFGNPAWPSIRTANFAAFEPWSRALSKNAESLGTAMRSCVSLFRGVAAPLGCVICLQLGDVAVFSLCAQYFLNVRGGGGITTPGVLCVLLKRWTVACQNGSFAAF